MSLLGQLIAKEEGFYVQGSVPQRNDNPGDLEHAPGETHSGSAIGSFSDADAGWQALERQLQLYAERGLTLSQAIYEFAPPSENNSAAYLAFVCKGLGCTPGITMTEALQIGAQNG